MTEDGNMNGLGMIQASYYNGDYVSVCQVKLL